MRHGRQDNHATNHVRFTFGAPVSVPARCTGTIGTLWCATLIQRETQHGFGGALIQQRHMWFVDPRPAVPETVWQIVVLSAMWAMEQSMKRLWASVPVPNQVGVCITAGRSTRFDLALVCLA
jgi:hypothetical protein